MKRKTKEDFIKDARKIHCDKYDYSKVEYINAHIKVCIICPEHGEFWQTPASHLNGRGCSKCSNENSTNFKKSKEYFIQRALTKHGDKYDYSKVEYVDSTTPVCIICPEHGEFWQPPHNHLNSNGCIKCSKEKSEKIKKVRYTTEKFILKARKIHGDKYDYSKVEYVDSTTPVCIICPEHGEFWQTPVSHLQNRGCNKCSKLMFDKESFVTKARKIHGDKYDYSKVEYVDSTTPVCIICPEHGEFWQTPSNHTNKNKPEGCCVCGRNKAKEKSKLQLSEFINKSNKIHNNKYNYSNVKYKNYHTHVCIICPKHGEFWQTPSHHLNNEGCPMCNTSKLENEVENVLKTNNINFIFQYSPNWANKFRYDFYLIESNIIIECQGEQHYYPVDFGGKGEEISKQNFKNNVENDIRKYNLAIENGCKILYYTKEKLKKNDEITNINNLIQKIKQLC